LSDLASCPAMVTIVDAQGGDIAVCRGIYYGDGSLSCEYDGVTFGIEPAGYYKKNPKRLFYDDGKGQCSWTGYYVKSIQLVIQ
jgi:hypothetical protein